MDGACCRECDSSYGPERMLLVLDRLPEPDDEAGDFPNFWLCRSCAKRLKRTTGWSRWVLASWRAGGHESRMHFGKARFVSEEAVKDGLPVTYANMMAKLERAREQEGRGE